MWRNAAFACQPIRLTASNATFVSRIVSLHSLEHPSPPVSRASRHEMLPAPTGLSRSRGELSRARSMMETAHHDLAGDAAYEARAPFFSAFVSRHRTFAFRAGTFAFGVGTFAFHVGTFACFAGDEAQASARLALAQLLDAIVPEPSIDVGEASGRPNVSSALASAAAKGDAENFMRG